MEPKESYVIVGLGTLVIILALFFSILWLNKGKGGSDQNRYIVLFRGVSLSGVQTDGLVTMRGIQVGRIKGIRISPSDIEQVEVEIAVNPDTPVREDTQAVIQTNILTGLSSIDLVGGSQGAKALTKAPKGYPYPVIKQGQSGLQEFTQTMPEVLKNIAELTTRAAPLVDDLRAFLTKENQDRIANILKNMDKVTSDVSQGSTKFTALLTKVSESLASLSDSLENDLSGTAKSLRELTETANRELIKVSEGFRGVSHQFTETARDFSPESSILLSPNKEGYGPGE
jgi:phospholipid/cholesterol/gamma-HCH transport system substrate-binding protein